MAKRSLQSSKLGIEKARIIFNEKGWTQQYLASAVGIGTRQPIWKFFKGQPIERHIFINICTKLDLDWQEIAELPSLKIDPKPNNQDSSNDLDGFVQKVRSQYGHKIQAQCGTMRLLDVPQPIKIDDIYINVNILKQIPGQTWLDLSDFQCLNNRSFDRFGLADIAQESISALEATRQYSKLMLLGKPGSGKTTFLQYIAIQCIQGTLNSDKIAVFIKLKNFAEDTERFEPGKTLNRYDFREYITQELSSDEVYTEQVEALLKAGKFLILLDGLDEIQEEDSTVIIKQIRKLSEEYYNNQFIITCRIATQQYRFEGFTDIEIADFNQAQIEAFAQKWFVAVGSNSPTASLTKSKQFIEKLQLPQNKQIRELAVTPILLNLTCLVFQAKGDFPTKRSNLYKQGLDIMLVRWDQARGIKRDNIYQNLSLVHKLKLLSRIAAITFEKEEYFFEQNTIQQYIADYLITLTHRSKDIESLQIDSESILKSIEAQHGLLVERSHGIYSFSHLTFQEYLTARNFVANSNPEVLEKNLNKLLTYINEPRWREVILLTAGIVGNGDYLLQLMKRHIDAIAADEELQKFLAWVNQKSASVKSPYKSAAVRAFYLTLALPCDIVFARDLALALALDIRLAKNLVPDLSLDLALNRLLNLSRRRKRKDQSILDWIVALNFAFPSEENLSDRSELGYQETRSALCEALQQLKKQLPELNLGAEELQAWWCANRQNWTEALRNTIIQHRNIGHIWQFSSQQQQLLQKYYDANLFLLDALNTEFSVTRSVRREVEERLLLPNTVNSEQ